VGVILGVAIMAVAVILFVMYKQRKGCFKRVGVPTNQTMPISLSKSMNSGDKGIEFASSAEKRRSLKHMSKIVEVNESQDLEDSERHKKAAHGDMIMNNDPNNLQSLQSLQQVTDTEEHQSKRHVN